MKRVNKTPSGSYIQTAVSEYFLSSSHSISHMLLIPIESLMKAIVLGKHVRRTSFINHRASGNEQTWRIIIIV